MTRSLILACIFLGCATGAPAKEPCDFSPLKPLVISHALLNAAIKRVEPDYPLLARSAKAEGEVEVKILVDRKGNVVKSCAVTGHPLLRAAAENAASQWKFKRNFGFSNKTSFKQKNHIQASLFFNFRIE